MGDKTTFTLDVPVKKAGLFSLSIVMQQADGNKSNYSSVIYLKPGAQLFIEYQFKGKYLFIDIWASWCVPCVKMTPFVQQLEKQYEGKNITFVAISIDANKQSWLKKMKELNMHGHQFLDLPGAFARSLNVSGIPHYMIYDPEGKLVVYKAAMPDNPTLKETIDSLLAK